MTALTIYNEDCTIATDTTTDINAIRSALKSIGVDFERWQANQPISSEAQQEEVLAAYDAEIKKLNTQYQFQSVDVVALRPDHPQKAEFRAKFLAEHTHKDFEIRFFVDGHGLFYLHVNDKVYLVLCEKNDLISVPANTTHWFDMGENPNFKCIRLFTTAEGWLGDFTGNDIAKRFPDFDSHLATLTETA